jgi:tetratricopeptide (TPR) repeat protein
MSHLRGFKQKITAIARLQESKAFDQALAEVDAAIESWPGNAHLHVLRSRLVQLQEEPAIELDEAKTSLQKAVELEKNSPEAAIELGYFLDNVEDDAAAASKAFSDGVAIARKLLIDGLIGQAKAFRQLGKKRQFLRALLEVLHLAQFSTRSKEKSNGAESDLPLWVHLGRQGFSLEGDCSEQVQELLTDFAAEEIA